VQVLLAGAGVALVCEPEDATEKRLITLIERALADTQLATAT
jgi:hypothetical protein